MTGQEHYFSSRPNARQRPRTVTAELAGAPRALITSSGVFSPDRLDRGTQVLLETVPPPPEKGPLLDLGCGWGPIALTMALAAPTTEVWAVDVNERALELTRENARRLGLDLVRAASPDAVPGEVRFAALWSNPPIRVGKTALHGLLEGWLPRLAPGGEAWLVVKKDLGADSLQRWLAERMPDSGVDRVASRKGYRVLRVSAPTVDAT